MVSIPSLQPGMSSHKIQLKGISKTPAQSPTHSEVACFSLRGRSGYLPHKTACMRILAVRNCLPSPSQMTKHSLWPAYNLATQLLLCLACYECTQNHTYLSLLALSQLFLQTQGLGLYFKAISGLNRQLYQTLILHLGATATTIFLWGKAVQKALERARESWRQSIFSLGVTQPMKQSFGEQQIHPKCGHL